ncbi:putative membrane protein [Mucilaginibacter sp. UYNi724]
MTDKFIFRFVAGVTIFVIAVVIVLNRHLIPGPATPPAFTPYLPLLNAILNGTCSVLLLTSLYFIKQGNITVHKRLNILTFCLSSLFLVSYILFHYLMQHDTMYGDTNSDGILSADERATAGSLRTIYLSLLVPHIILAAGVLPLILLSFYRGLQMQVAKHKKLVRWAFPIWLFVTISGVVVYLMIKPYYHF